MPLFRAGKPKWRLSLTADRAFAAGARIVPWDQADYEEPGAIWDGVGSITVDRPGTYLIGGRVGSNTIATTASPGLAIQVNGTTVAHMTVTSTTLVTAIQIVDQLALAAGDVVALYYQRSGTLASTNRQIDSCFFGHRCGPVRWT